MELHNNNSSSRPHCRRSHFAHDSLLYKSGAGHDACLLQPTAAQITYNIGTSLRGTTRQTFRRQTQNDRNPRHGYTNILMLDIVSKLSIYQNIGNIELPIYRNVELPTYRDIELSIPGISHRTCPPPPGAPVQFFMLTLKQRRYQILTSYRLP